MAAAGFVLAASIASGTALAEETDVFAGHESAAWAKLHEGLLQYLSEHDASRVTYVAYHGVAAALCDGVETDKEKARAALVELHPANWDELSEDSRKHWNDVLLVNYGMAFGVLLAEHADHVGEMCEEVAETMSDAEAEHLFASK